MFTTALFIAVLVLSIVLSLLLWMGLLRLGLRWGRVEGVTWGAIGKTLAILFVIHFSIALVLQWDFPSDEAAILAALAGFALVVFCDIVVIRRQFRVGLGTAFKAWLPTLLLPAAAALLSFGIVRPFLFEPFLIPTNSMAPTIRGTHAQGICPECGGAAYFTPALERMQPIGPVSQICDSFHVTSTNTNIAEAITGDRIAVAKFLAPRRWDLVVFRFPGDPSVFYVKRLVGLPGETIHIDNGSVFANGEKLVPPGHLAGLEYLAEIPEMQRQRAWGTVSQPAVLGEGEYFMLGDFSAQALDSRYWIEGAPGHPPYAVPESYLRGVVTHTVWPPSRWRVHR